MLTVEGLNQQRKRHGCPHSPTGSSTASSSSSSSLSLASSDSNFGLGNYFEWNDLITRANFFGQSLYPSIVSQSFTPLTDHHVLNENNINLTAAQRELELWHCRLGHCDFNRVQTILAKRRVTKSSIPGSIPSQFVQPLFKEASSCPIPVCSACQYAKQRRRTPDSSIIKAVPEKEGAITSSDFHVGDRIACDQYISCVLGHLSNTCGCEGPTSKYVGGTIFVD